MPQGETLRIDGYQQLMKALKQADRDSRLFVRHELRAAAEPVRSTAQFLAGTEIPRMRSSPKWAGMRTGVTTKLIYVAPRQKGTRGRGAGRRPNLANLLMDRAMEPALKRNESRTVRRVEQAMDRVADHFNRGEL